MEKFLGEFEEIWVDEIDDIMIGDIVNPINNNFRYYRAKIVSPGWGIHKENNLKKRIYKIIGFDRIENVDVFLFDGYDEFYFDTRDFRKC